MSLRALTVAGLLALATRVNAQVRADPGTVINGRVAVRVNITLSDAEASYVPIAGVSLRFFRTTADTTVVGKTDDAGSATVLLTPGEYRLMTTTPVDWKGSRYSWSQLVEVRAGLPTIELTTSTAARVEMQMDSTVAPVRPATRRSAFADEDEELVAKDPSKATMLSFFVTGVGQMYAGEPWKGGGLLALTAVGVGVAAKQLSCAGSSSCESTNAKRALGVAGAVAFFGSWIYSIMDAGDAARRFNTAHGLAEIGPLIAPDGQGRTRVGLSLALGR